MIERVKYFKKIKKDYKTKIPIDLHILMKNLKYVKDLKESEIENLILEIGNLDEIFKSIILLEKNIKKFTNIDRESIPKIKNMFFDIFPDILFLVESVESFASILKCELKVSTTNIDAIYNSLYIIQTDYSIDVDFYNDYLKYLSHSTIENRGNLIFILQFLLNDDLTILLKMKYIKKIFKESLKISDSQKLCDVFVVMRYLFNEQPSLYRILHKNVDQKYEGEYYLSEMEIYRHCYGVLRDLISDIINRTSVSKLEFIEIK